MSLTNDERKALVKAKRGRVSRIARQAGVSQSYVSHVIAGRMTGSPRIRSRIARAIGLSVDDVFPSLPGVAPQAHSD